MESTNDIEYYLKNAYRALAELLIRWPKDGLKSKIAFYDYFQGNYCYAVFSECDGFLCLRVYPHAEAFVNFLEAEKNQADDFYYEASFIAQEYTAVYFLKEDTFSENFRKMYLPYALSREGRLAVFCKRSPGEAEKILTDKNALLNLSSIMERTRELLNQGIFSDKSFKNDDGLILLDYQNGAWQKKYLPYGSIYAKLKPASYDNSFFLHRIARKKSDEGIYELSWFYIPIEQYSEQGGYYPLYANLVDLASGMVIFSTLVRSKNESKKKVLDDLAQSLVKRELRVGYIVTADYGLWRQMESFCAKSKIELRYIEQGIVKERIMEGFKLMCAPNKQSESQNNGAEIIRFGDYCHEKFSNKD